MTRKNKSLHQSRPVTYSNVKQFFKLENEKYTKEWTRENEVVDEMGRLEPETVDSDGKWELRSSSNLKKVVAHEYNEKEQGPIRFEDQNENISRRKLDKIRKMQELQKEKILGGRKVELDEREPREKRSARTQIYDKYEKNLNFGEFVKTEKPDRSFHTRSRSKEIDRSRETPSRAQKRGKKKRPILIFRPIKREESEYQESPEKRHEVEDPLADNRKSREMMSGEMKRLLKESENSGFKITPKKIRSPSSKKKNKYISPEKMSKGDIETFGSCSSHDIYDGLRDDQEIMEAIREAQEKHLKDAEDGDLNFRNKS